MNCVYGHVHDCPHCSCPTCQSEAITRFSKTASGFQRFRCKDCRVTFSDAPPREHAQSLKDQVLVAYEERASITQRVRGIARAYKISRNTLTKWIKEKGG